MWAVLYQDTGGGRGRRSMDLAQLKSSYDIMCALGVVRPQLGDVFK